jgi:hypothetical protein
MADKSAADVFCLLSSLSLTVETPNTSVQKVRVKKFGYLRTHE